MEVDSNKRQEQAQSVAVRLTVLGFGTLAASAPAEDAAVQAGEVLTLRRLVAYGRLLAPAPPAPASGYETAASDADLRTADDLAPVVDSVGRPLDPATGVDPVTRAVVGSTTDDHLAILARMAGAVRRADRFGRRGSRAVFALSILALAAVLFGRSAVLGAQNHGSLTLALGAVALVAAAAYGASALTI